MSVFSVADRAHLGAVPRAADSEAKSDQSDPGRGRGDHRRMRKGHDHRVLGMDEEVRRLLRGDRSAPYRRHTGRGSTVPGRYS